MGTPTPSPTPMPTPSPSGISSSPSSANPSPTPSPQPNYPPVPNLPDLPSNAYQLLLALASTIDTTSGNFKTSSGKLSAVQSTTNSAVGGIVANSQGVTTRGLGDIWQYTQKDFTNASTPLTSITTSNALGGSPNQLQVVLDQHRSDFVNGIPAVEKLRQLAATHYASMPSVDMVQGLVSMAQGLIDAMGNVNMALWAMITAISNINSGISWSCATGFAPGLPVPQFSPHAFAMEGNGGSGSSDMTADQLRDYLIEQGVDESTALNIALFAEAQGLSLSDIKTMLDTLVQGGNSPEIVAEQLQTLIDNESLGNWFNGQPGRNLSDVTALLNNGFSSDAVTTLLNQGADLRTTLNNAQYLLSKNVSLGQINQWTQQGLNLNYAKVLLDKGINPSQIDRGIANYTNPDLGNRSWQAVDPAIKNDIGGALRRWANGTNYGRGNDGQPFNNNPQWVSQNGQRVQQYPFPGNNSGPYTEYYVGGGDDRIVIDRYGKAYYYPSGMVNHYNPNDAIPIPYSFIAHLF